MRTDLPAYVRQIYVRDFRARIGLWQSLPPHPSRLASYLVSVRRTSVLPAASFRFHLAMDTLAVQLAVPLAEPALDFHQLVNAPCRAHKKKAAPWGRRDENTLSISIYGGETAKLQHRKDLMQS